MTVFAGKPLTTVSAYSRADRCRYVVRLTLGDSGRNGAETRMIQGKMNWTAIGTSQTDELVLALTMYMTTLASSVPRLLNTVYALVSAPRILGGAHSD